MKIDRSKVLATVLITLLTIILMIVIGPADIFTHGYFCDEVDYNMVKQDVNLVELEENYYYEYYFSPQKDHFVGFEINLLDVSEINEGKLFIEIQSESGKTMDTINVDLGEVSDGTWFKTYSSVDLKKNDIYKLRLMQQGSEIVPCLQKLDYNYNDENINNNLLIGYAYAESTFSFSEKVIICIFLLAGWIFVIATLNRNCKMHSKGKWVAGTLLIMAILSWNYSFNSMDNQNIIFNDFDMGSEALVRGVVEAEKNNVWFTPQNQDDVWTEQYGLGYYWSDVDELSDENWCKGFSRSEPAVIVYSTDYSRNYAIVGNYIEFESGACYRISEVVDDGTRLIIKFATDKMLNHYKCGDLKDGYYCDANCEKIRLVSHCGLNLYMSQYGLQGKVFCFLARHLREDDLYSILQLLPSLALGLTLAILIVLIYVKYNMLYATSFFLTFWLSPWIVSYAKNLYWVEFTWFVPMVIGVFCAWKIRSRRCRIVSYILSFIAITVKCLCGYEFISTIMMVSDGTLREAITAHRFRLFRSLRLCGVA